MNNRRAVIISLDGGSWNVLEPLLQQGFMPHFYQMIERGARGPLTSTFPPLTPPAWVSFQTGVQPSHHGVFAFTEIGNDGWPLRNVVSANSVRVKTIWQFLSERGKRFLLVDVPLTYPFRPLNGCYVSDVFIPYNTPEYTVWTFPKRLGKMIDREVGGWRFIRGPEMLGKPDHSSIMDFISLMSEFIRQREMAVCYLMKREEWDICMVHFHATDVLQHALWGFLDRDHPMFQKDMYAEVARFYEVVDSALGRILQAAPPGTLRLVVSDHGFRPHRKVLKLNAWLYQQKLLKTAWSMEVKRVVRNHRLLRKGITCLNKLRASGASWLLDHRKEYLIDRGRTRAVGTAGPWQSIHGLISINKELPEAQRQEYMRAIITGLSELHDPETGEPIISAVRGISEVYGPETDQGCPDLIVIPADDYSIDPGFPHDPIFKKIAFSDSFHIGTHSTQGICVFEGPGIIPNAPLRPHLIDMAPTLIYYLGEQVPSYMQGRVLKEIIKEDLLCAQPVQYIEDEGVPEGPLGARYSEDEQAGIEQRLQELGYL